MDQIRYRKGTTLFVEGDYSDHVLRIIEGEVEVLKKVDDQQVLLGHLREGEFVGEMGVLEGKPRSATVRAASDVAAEHLDRDSFLRLISADGATAFKLMVRLSERLAATDRAYARSVADLARSEASFDRPPAGSADNEIGAKVVTLYPGSDRMEGALSANGLVISQFPFVVGRTVGRREATPACHINLTVADKEPFRMSRLHFWLARTDDGFCLRDSGSTLGTIVNGVGIGQHFASDTAALEHGENVVVAGGVGSPYAFRIVLE